MANLINTFDFSDSPIIILKEKKIVDCNESAIILFCAKNKNQIISKDIIALFSVKDPQPLELLIDETERNGQSTFTFIAKNIKNEIFGVKVSSLCLRVGKGKHLIQTVWHSLTKYHPNDEFSYKMIKRRIQKNSIISSDFTFKKWADNAPDAIMVFDRDLKHLYVNDQIQHLTGLPASQFLGKTHRELGLSPEPISKWEKSLKNVFETGKEEVIKCDLPSGSMVEWYLIPDVNDKNHVNTVMATVRDISSQRTIEKVLEKNRAVLIDALKIANLATWEYLPENDVFIMNHRFCEQFGLDFNPNILEVNNGLDFLTQQIIKDDRNILNKSFEKAIKATKNDYADIFEYRIKKGNSVINILTSLRIVKNEQGDTIKCYGTTQDITELRKTQEELNTYRKKLEYLVKIRTLELKQSEEKLKDALDLANLATWEYDCKKKLFHVNDKILEMYGTNVEIEKGYILSHDRFQQMVHPEDWSIYEAAAKKALKSDDENFLDYIKFRVVGQDGEVRHLYVSNKIKIGPDGQHIKHYGTVQDVSSIVKTEKEKERFVSIIEATTDIVSIANANGNILYINEAGRKFFNLTNEQICAHKDFSCDILFPKDSLKKAAKRGAWSGENRLSKEDGSKIPVSQVVLAHKNTNGKLESYSTILRDISEQKIIEQDLKYKNHELDTFVYRASHDLRGPIASLLGLYNIVKYEVTDEQALKFFTLYHKQIARLNKIVLSLIELTRIKDEDIQYVSIDFQKIISECLIELKKLPRFQKINFKTQVSLNYDFKSDKMLIKTILQNLIENAIKYSRNISTAYVSIGINKRGDYMIIEVEDNGVGIEKKFHNKIFNMFFRGNEKSVGSGLGLYILKNALDRLKGKINLESEPGKGSKFTVQIPLQDPEGNPNI